MKYRILGRTGLRVSALCLGTMNFGPRTPAEEAARIIHRALDDGINFIDTANLYGRPLKGGRGHGETEKIVGKALAEAGGRHRIILATKVAAPQPGYPDEDPNAGGTTRHHIMHQVDESLRRLETDYIDLYYLHRPQPSAAIDDTLRALDDLIRAGKVRYIGTSMFAPWRLVDALWTSHEQRLNRFVAEQMEYNLLNRGPEAHLFEVAERFGVGLVPYSPLAGGNLTGKYRGEEVENARKNYEPWSAWTHSQDRDHAAAVLDVLESIAQEKDATLSQVALAWTLRKPVVASTIIGPRTESHYADNLGALEVALTEEDFARLDEVAPVLGSSGR